MAACRADGSGSEGSGMSGDTDVEDANGNLANKKTLRAEKAVVDKQVGPHTVIGWICLRADEPKYGRLDGYVSVQMSPNMVDWMDMSLCR
jgi:hypothetical protein